MKKFLLSLIALFALGSIIGCTASSTPTTITENKTQKPHIAATLFPVYDIAKNVAGDAADVELILAPGASPHTFDASPSDLTKLQSITRIFAIGQGIDSWSFGIADNIPGAEIIELDKNINLKESTEHEDEDEYEGKAEHEEEADEHGELDPHYWLDPNNAMIMANTIADELGTLDPTNAEQYRQNADNFTKMLQNEDVTWKTTINALPEKNIITFHDGFFYFADHFGLNVVTTFEPFPGKEPTPSYLQELEKEIKENNIRVLFTEPQLHGASLKQFAKDHDISVSVLDPLGGVDGRQSYSELINTNVQTIVEALK